MSSQYEDWYFVSDGYQAMRRGLEATNTLLGTVEDVKSILKNADEITKEIERYEQELLQKSDGTGS